MNVLQRVNQEAREEVKYVWFIFLKGLTDVLLGTSDKCELRGDNQGALALSVNPVYHQRTKHIDIRHRFICEMVPSRAISPSVRQANIVPFK